METDGGSWADYCAVELVPTPACVLDEDIVNQWVCDLEHELVEPQRPEEEHFDAQLDPDKVAAARAEEVAYMENRGLWDVVRVPRGVRPTSVRWVDVVKKGRQHEEQVGGTGLQRG